MDKWHSPSHHPDDGFLRHYAAGSVVGARALIAAAHLTYCPECRAKVASAETLCGELLEMEPGVDTAMREGHDAKSDQAQAICAAPGDEFSFAPKPVRHLLEGAGARWVNVWFGVKELPIPGFSPAARLLWIPAGRRMPRHDHVGEEMTLVLVGDFSDRTGRYAAGDLQIGMPGLDHQPHAGSDGPCVCLVVEQGGLKLSGWLGRLVAWRGGDAGRTRAA